MRDDDCLDLGSNYRYGEKQRDLRCFWDRAGIGLICGKGGLDFCLEGTDGFMCVWEGEDWKRNRLRGGNISFYLFIYFLCQAC